MDTQVIIMAGGVGSRLLPVSTPSLPKQFIDILGCGKTLLQLTFERFLPSCNPENFWVVTSTKYKHIVKEQLPELAVNHILTEPEARGTAPCIAYATWKIAKHYPNANLIFTPADALVLDKTSFNEVIKKAIELTANSDKLITIGIKANKPSVAYGYIKVREKDKLISKVEAFKEKPTKELAEQYLTEGNYLWNAGIFIWNTKTIITEFNKNHPQIAGIMEQLSPFLNTEKEDEFLLRLFPLCENISIDYAIMEKSKNIYTIKGTFDWSDLGSWSSIKEKLYANQDNNSSLGAKVEFYDCENTLSYLPDIEKAVIEGLNDYLIIQKDGCLIIVPKTKESQIKKYLEY